MSFRDHYKLLLIGDSGVGKTSISLRLARDEFSHNQKATIGTAFERCEMYLEVADSINAVKVPVLLW